MTEQERFSVRGRFSVEVSEAEEILAIRQAEALRLAAKFREVADVLTKNVAASPSGEDCEVGLHPSQILPELTFKSVFDYAAAIGALTELRKARQAVYDARQRESLVRGRHGINTLGT